MAEPILSGYLSNLGKYTEGRPAGEWVTFPTTAEHLKEVFDRIGIDFKHYEEWHFTEFQSPIPGLTEHLSEYSHPDELNYLGKLLEMQFDDDREKFIAAIEYCDHADSLQDIINLAQNLDCYWLYPSVHNEEEYGHYLVDELEEPELSDEVKRYFMYAPCQCASSQHTHVAPLLPRRQAAFRFHGLSDNPLPPAQRTVSDERLNCSPFGVLGTMYIQTQYLPFHRSSRKRTQAFFRPSCPGFRYSQGLCLECF